MTSQSLTYRIADEPDPGKLSKLAVNPLWPFLAVMLGGAVFGWVWFALNTVAIGSATRRREMGLLALGVVGGAAVCLAVLWLYALLPASIGPYVFLAIPVWKLGISYLVHLSQVRSIEVFEFYGGALRNPLPVLLGLWLLRGVLPPVPVFLKIWLF